jgi:hypothetical protein
LTRCLLIHYSCFNLSYICMSVTEDCRIYKILKKSLCTVWNYEMQWVDCSSFFLFLLLFSSGNNYWLTIIACWTNILHNSWFQPISYNWLSLYPVFHFLKYFVNSYFIVHGAYSNSFSLQKIASVLLKIIVVLNSILILLIIAVDKYSLHSKL